MKVLCTHKSYSGRGLNMVNGQIEEVPQQLGESLIKDFPLWFQQVPEMASVPPVVPPVDPPDAGHDNKGDDEKKGDDKKDPNNVGGGGSQKETKPGKAKITK